MATIKAIEGRSVHQIQSGQVIIDLNAVVKELVENSLDAEATSIEVRFKNQGLDTIEVQDNGKGIAPEDFETVALKHHTSKLSSYEDLTSLDTFGFRGEALSSLCALSQFHIVTARAEDGAVGKRLEFEVSGKLKGTSITAAQKGTTAVVENLFSSLPVRRKELEKNVKREYGKVIALLHAYACISVGVRFAVSNQMPKGKKLAVFSTRSNTTTKENIVNVYGAKTSLGLINLDLRLEMEGGKGRSAQSVRNWSTPVMDRSMEVLVRGHISKPVFGEGRQAPDRQMFFVNSRPCQLPQISKAINEIYKSFNVTQSPFVFANLLIDTSAYDVNVSPDKRTILLHDQTALLESLKTALTELFEQTGHTVPQSQFNNRKLPDSHVLAVPRRTSAELNAPAKNGESHSDAIDNESDCSSEATAKPNQGRRHCEGIDSPPSLIHNWIDQGLEDRKVASTSNGLLHSLPKDNQSPAMQMQKQHALSNGEDNNDSTHVDRAAIHTGDRYFQEPRLTRNDFQVLDSTNAQQVSGVKSHLQLTGQELVPESPSDDGMSHQRPTHLSWPPQNPAAPPASFDKSLPPLGLDTTDVRPRPDAEPAISVITPRSQKASAGPVQNAFDRMRSKRTPLHTAEITVGDTTTTTILGTIPPYKKRRIHQPASSQSLADFGASPLLARGLRNFAAPGSHMAVDSSEETSAKSVASHDEESEDPNDSPNPVEQGEVQHESRQTFPKVDKEDMSTSDPFNEIISSPAGLSELDEDYIDEREKKVLEDKQVARLIQKAEEAAARPTEDNLHRASQALKNGGNRKDSTLRLACHLNISNHNIEKQLHDLDLTMQSVRGHDGLVASAVVNELDDKNAESRLSLTVRKSDFDRMKIIGQFNLGFILTTRPAANENDEDELFIIDQHAADEKYNYERLQRTVTLQNQRLVRPKRLELTALEEEIILNNTDALKYNGFEIESTSSLAEAEPTDHRCVLVALPVSGEKTFDLSDLEELLHLLSEAPTGGSEIPRPKKVQRMLAMRACRSSIMVGKTLTQKQMQKVVRHMGEMEKPWNCPHGRPTMRHLAGLGSWEGWQEGQVINADEDHGSEAPSERYTDWKRWLEGRS